MKKYHEYKPTSLPWLPEVPAHWEVKKLKYVAKINNKSLSETTNPELEIEYIDIGNVAANKLLNPPEKMTFKSAPSRARRIVSRGDTIISCVRTYLKAITHIEVQQDNLIASTGFAVLTPKMEVIPKFLCFAVQSDSFTENVTAHSTGVNYPAITAFLLGNLPIPLPPLSEQVAIVEFIESRLADITRLVDAKRRLLALLDEQRAALIARAVTHGLNPKAPRRPTGIEWLPEVPAHWEVKKLKYLATFTYGESLPDSIRIDGDVPVYGSNGEVGKHNQSITKAPCIIVGRKGSFGKVNFSERECFPIDTTYFIDADCTNENLRWLFYILQTLGLDDVSQDTGVPGLSREYAYQKLVPLPPLSEQAEIVAYIEWETSAIDAAQSRIVRELELLDEWKTALISAAVTGQIRVA